MCVGKILKCINILNNKQMFFIIIRTSTIKESLKL